MQERGDGRSREQSSSAGEETLMDIHEMMWCFHLSGAWGFGLAGRGRSSSLLMALWLGCSGMSI